MIIAEKTKPVQRTFTIEVSEDELKVITHALYVDKSDLKYGDAGNYDLWLVLDDYHTNRLGDPLRYPLSEQ